jgi:hypothetical protein
VCWLAQSALPLIWLRHVTTNETHIPAQLGTLQHDWVYFKDNKMPGHSVDAPPPISSADPARTQAPVGVAWDKCRWQSRQRTGSATQEGGTVLEHHTAHATPGSSRCLPYFKVTHTHTHHQTGRLPASHQITSASFTTTSGRAHVIGRMQDSVAASSAACNRVSQPPALTHRQRRGGRVLLRNTDTAGAKRAQGLHDRCRHGICRCERQLHTSPQHLCNGSCAQKQWQLPPSNPTCCTAMLCLFTSVFVQPYSQQIPSINLFQRPNTTLPTVNLTTPSSSLTWCTVMLYSGTVSFLRCHRKCLSTPDW